MVSEIADTKRSVLSTIAQIYDPIGLLAHVMITAKLVLQELWKLNIAWDDALPQDLQAKWAKFKTQLSHLDKLYIPRGVFRSIPTEVQCHGFYDASMYAYGACIYFRASYADGSRSSQLVCSKSNIAPLKNITLTRLELSAALLLAKLYKHVMAIIDIQISDTILWCDSIIVLAWLKTDPVLLKMFVSNRIAEILDLTPNILWRHVPSKENAADLVSRSVSSPAELINYDLWWHGPSWLIEDPSNWPNRLSNTTVENIPERRVLVAIDSNNSFLEEVAGRFSNFNKIVRVVAYCLRWLTRICRHIVPEHNLGVLLAAELRSATNRIVYLIQKDNFGEVLYNLKAAKQSNTSLGKLKALNPFIDADGLLRVGGRLENADSNYDQKHPMILLKGNSVAKMLIKAEHERLLYADTQTVLANIRLKYWPLDGQNTIKDIIHKCVKCARFRATKAEQLMGSLPRDRVTAHRPFQVILRSSKLRKAPQRKAYIALFVCMATKAIHIELVTSLSTEGFLAALRRFVARRGCCSIIHSDNGKNFVGARNELRMLASLLRSDVNKQELITGATQMGITWQFTPSYAPHFGGLWEGSIKVMKHHPRKVIGSHCLTYEEYATILTQIEAILKSRPILALTDDSTDTAFISPGHFLTALPEPYVNNCNANLTKLYKVSSKMRDQFWSVWSKQYLSDLQKRKKWSTEQPNVQKDQIVLLKEDNMPPLHWPMGRIMDTKPGHDGKVREVVIKTSNGTYTRPIAKVVPLPCE